MMIASTTSLPVARLECIEVLRRNCWNFRLVCVVNQKPSFLYEESASHNESLFSRFYSPWSSIFELHEKRFVSHKDTFGANWKATSVCWLRHGSWYLMHSKVKRITHAAPPLVTSCLLLRATCVREYRVRAYRRSHGDHAPQISSISCYFVLREAVSQTKYCCSLKVKRFDPPKLFGLATQLGPGD